MPRKKHSPTMLVCPDGHYQVDANTEGLKVPGKIPECPHCKKSLSFEGAGTFTAEENPFAIWLTAFLILIPLLSGVFLHFKEYDRRKINPHQPVAAGQVFYGGKVRIRVPVAGPSFLQYLRLRFYRPPAPNAKTKIKMVTRRQDYIFSRLEGQTIEIEYREEEEGKVIARKGAALKLNHGTAELGIPPPPEMKNGRQKKLLLHVTGEELTVREI